MISIEDMWKYDNQIMAKGKLKKGISKVKRPLFFYIFFLIIFLGLLGAVIFDFVGDQKEDIIAISLNWDSEVLVCNSSCEKEIYNYQVISDGSEGVIVSWFDPEGITLPPPESYMKKSIVSLANAGEIDGGVFIEKINSSGSVQWGADSRGLNINSDDEEYLSLTSVTNDNGGAIIVWTSCYYIDLTPYCYMHISNIDTDGIESEWNYVTPNSEFDQYYTPALVSDEASGAIVVWSYDGLVKTSKFDFTGARQWGADGFTISGSSEGYNPVAASDGSGGVFSMWVCDHGGMDPQDYVYVQKVDSNGDVQWGSNGVTICDENGFRANYYKSIIHDGSGGAYFVWEDDRSGNTDVYAQRVDSGGSIQWGEDGQAICSESGNQTYIYSVSDGSGGVIVAWSDNRGTDMDIYAQRLNSSGEEQWTSGGELICGSIGDQYLQSIVADGEGNFALAWIDSGECSDIYTQFINSSGEKESEDATQVLSGSACGLGMTQGDNGEVSMAWVNSSYEVYAQQIQSEGFGSALENGEICSDDSECLSDFCIDGYCCESECSGTCRSCDQAGHLGECYLHADNTDPDNECSQSLNACTSKCVLSGGDGYCDGAGACDTDDLVENADSGYVCIGAGNEVAVSAVNYCNYEEDCDDGDCNASKWYTSCNGSGVCRAASDHTDAYVDVLYASVNKVLDASCNEVDAGESNSCDGSVDYYSTEGACIYSRRYAECDGSGTCDDDSSDHYESSSLNVPDGNVAVLQTGGENLPYGTPTVTNYCNSINNCDDGDCSATKWYRACNGSGSCRSDNIGSESENIYAEEGHTLTDDCEVDGDGNCDFIGLSCSGNCEMEGIRYKCGELYECDYNAGIDNEYCEAGTSCEDGECSSEYYCNSEEAVSFGEGDDNYNTEGDYYCKGGCDGSNNCDYAIDCRLLSDVEEDDVEEDDDDDDGDDDDDDGDDGDDDDDDEQSIFTGLPETGEDEDEPYLKVLSDNVVNTVLRIRENEIIVNTTETIGTSLSVVPLALEIVQMTLPIISTFGIGPANFFMSLIYLMFREKENHWGIIYNKEKNIPIPFAVINVEDKGKEGDVQTKVSDIQGRYSLILDKGNYKISVRHSDYKEYRDEFKINNKNQISIDTDIGLYPKELNLFNKIFIDLKEFINVLFDNYGYFILIIGMWIAIIVWLIVPSLLNLLIIVIYIPFILLYYRSRTQYPQNWGKVIDSLSNEPISGAFVKIYKKKNKELILIDSVITNLDGKYGFLIDKKGKYYIQISATGYSFPSKKNKYPTEFYGSLIQINIGKDKMLKENLYMDSKVGGKESKSTPFK